MLKDTPGTAGAGLASKGSTNRGSKDVSKTVEHRDRRDNLDCGEEAFGDE